ncbi:tetratricopeptide repeat protein [Streptomyces sp. NPDC004647]|uniref:ATP-binding protein n=1 Tax=Streptomyces sp. NPDC004647 TaxID=3154671 RepID=UPI0033AC6E1B
MFGDALRKRREDAALSLRELAERANYSAGYLSKLESGQRPPNPEVARACDEVLGARGELVALAQAAPHKGGLGRPSQLPPGAAGFVGRIDVLSELDSLLADAEREGTALALSIDGPPGAGKSALMTQWAHRVADRFPGGVLFTDLQGHTHRAQPVDPSHVLESFLRAFELSAEAIPIDISERAALFRSLVTDRRVLVLLDNAASSQQVRPLMVAAPGCAVLVTSRRRLTSLAVSTGARRVSLEPMEEQESVQLLTAVLGQTRADAEPKAVRDLACRCGHLPLALRIAAERLATHRHLPVAAAVAELADPEDRLDRLADGEDPHLAMRPVFNASYREIDAAVARTFRLLGLFPGRRITTPAAAALIGQPPGRTRRLLEELVGVHLLEEIFQDTYRFHDLLRVYAAECVEQEENEPDRTAAVRRLADWYAHTVDAANLTLAPQRIVAPLDAPTPGVTPLTFTAVDAARQWCDAEGANFEPLVRMAAQHGLPAAWQIPTRLWNWLLLVKPWGLWIETHRVGLQAATDAGSAEAQAWVALNLAEAYRQSGSYDQARQHLEQALALRLEIGDRHGQAWVLTCLGFADTDQGDTAGACSRFEQALQLFEEAADLHGQAIVLASVAESYGRLGRQEDEQRAFDASLSLARDLEDPYGEAMTWLRRANLQLQRGELDAAVESLDRSVDRRRAAGDDWGAADALDRRARILHDDHPADEAKDPGWRAQARRDRARESWQAAHDIFEQLGDPRAAQIREQLSDLDDEAN